MGIFLWAVGPVRRRGEGPMKAVGRAFAMDAAHYNLRSGLGRRPLYELQKGGFRAGVGGG